MSDLGNREVFAKNLQSYMDKFGISRRELSDKMDVGYTTLTDWIKGNTYPRIDKIEMLANYFHIQKSDLIESKERKSDIPTNIEMAQIRNIPLIGVIACGEPITAEQNIEEYIPTLDKDLPAGELFYLRAKGDSMAPDIKDGSDVLCRAQPDVESGEIAAVLVNGDEEATLKKVHKLDGYVLLEALNEAYAPYLVNEDHPARIVGKAVKVVNDL